MKSKLLLLSLIFFGFMSEGNSQVYWYYSRTHYHYGPYYFSAGLNVLTDIIAYKRMKEERAEFLVEMGKRTDEIRDYYGEFSNYPQSVKNGWHQVTIVAGSEFIDGRKVYVENNRIKKVVWDNWMRENLVSAGPIEKGKAKIQLDSENHVLNRFLDVYFINYIADSTEVAAAPPSPATITFWTDEEVADDVSFLFNGKDYGRFTRSSPANYKAECGDITELTFYVKPGIHSFKAVNEAGRNFTLLDSKVKVESGDCKVVFIPGEKPIKIKKNKKSKS